MTVFIQGDQVRTIQAGIAVTKTAAVAASGSADDLFSIDDGAVILLGLVGEVETALVADTDLDVDFDPDDGGSDVALASTLVADSDAVGTMYTLNSTNGGALVATLDVAYNALLADPIVLQEGDLKLVSSGGGAGGGSIKWTALYIPLETGASLTAAA